MRSEKLLEKYSLRTRYNVNHFLGSLLSEYRIENTQTIKVNHIYFFIRLDTIENDVAKGHKGMSLHFNFMHIKIRLI